MNYLIIAWLGMLHLLPFVKLYEKHCKEENSLSV